MAILGIDLQFSCRAASLFRHLAANAELENSISLCLCRHLGASSNESAMPRPKAANDRIDCLDLHLLRSPFVSLMPGSTITSTPVATSRRLQTAHGKGNHKHHDCPSSSTRQSRKRAPTCQSADRPDSHCAQHRSLCRRPQPRSGVCNPGRSHRDHRCKDAGRRRLPDSPGTGCRICCGPAFWLAR